MSQIPINQMMTYNLFTTNKLIIHLAARMKRFNKTMLSLSNQRSYLVIWRIWLANWMRMIIARIRALRTIKLEGIIDYIQLSSLPYRWSFEQQVCSHTKTWLGTLLDCMAGQRFQVLDLRGSQNNEKCSSLSLGIIRWGTSPLIQI